MATTGRPVLALWGGPAGGLILALATLVLLSAAAPAGAAAPERPVSVLLVYAEARILPAVIAQDEALRTALQAGLPRGVFFHTEYLDTAPLPASAEASLVEVLEDKYRARPIDLVIASTSVGLRFVLRHRARLFPEVPVVFMSVNQAAAADLDLGGSVSGTWQSLDWAGTLEVALRLQPGTRRVAVVTGASSRDRIWRESAREQLTPYQDRLEIRYLPAPSLDEALQEVARLPADAVVLLGPFLQDATGRDFVGTEVATRVAAAAPVSVYGLFETHVGRGIIGGRVVSPAALGEQTARLALRVLAGESPGPPVTSASVGTFDWRQLERWGLDGRRLPAGSVVLFREPSAWERYRWWIVGAVSLVLLQSALIAALLVHRALRRRAQQALAERLRFETLLADLSALFATGAVSDVDGQIETALRRLVEDLGIDRVTLAALPASSDEVRVTHSWTRDGVRPLAEMLRGNDVPWIVSELRRGRVVRLGRAGNLPAAATIDRRSVERFGTRSGVVVPLVVGGSTIGGLAVATLREAHPWSEALVPRLRILADLFASALARRDAERTAHESATQIQTLAGRLITAQEEERRRIARELHDDVGQRVASLAIGLSGLKRWLPDAAGPVRDALSHLQQETLSLSKDLRQLSHELHPGALEHVGLIEALRGRCDEMSAAPGIAARLDVADGWVDVRDDIALCLYRVAQEALRNIGTHARATRAEISLARRDGQVVMRISDDGQGFEPGAADERSGLGLVSMGERVCMLGGRLEVQTSPNAGTVVAVTLPAGDRT